MAATATATVNLSRSDAILRILEVLESADAPPVQRLLLEGMAFVAQQPTFDEKQCRVLRSFDSEEWLLDFHESLAYLQQMGRIKRTAGEYFLTRRGHEQLENLDESPRLDLQHESQQIQDLAQRVRSGLGL